MDHMSIKLLPKKWRCLTFKSQPIILTLTKWLAPACAANQQRIPGPCNPKLSWSWSCLGFSINWQCCPFHLLHWWGSLEILCLTGISETVTVIPGIPPLSCSPALVQFRKIRLKEYLSTCHPTPSTHLSPTEYVLYPALSCGFSELAILPQASRLCICRTIFILLIWQW